MGDNKIIIFMSNLDSCSCATFAPTFEVVQIKIAPGCIFAPGCILCI